MANQVEPGTAGGAAPQPAAPGGQQGTLAQPSPGGSLTPHAFHGRPVSWVAVTLVMAGFVVGGLALIFGHGGPTWWLFWVGVGLCGLGTLLALATDIFDDWY